MLVEQYKLENTTIKIYDDAYAGKAQEDIERLIKRVEELGGNNLKVEVANE